MKITERNVIPVSVSHYLHVVHGIKLKTIRTEKRKSVSWGVKVFGVSLESLPQCLMADNDILPRFLVDACTHLLEHVCCEGLFRKSGAVVRQKALRARLNRGEACISTALPYDVACLLKQFCRELPKPLFPPDLQAALLKAQRLPSVKERTSAIQLLSCLLPQRNLSFLRYILIFLSKVSQRCSENQMTCRNLALVFAPCLMSLGRTAEEPDGSIHLKTEVVQSLIENAYTFGVIPEFILKSVPVLLDPEERTLSERTTVLEGAGNYHQEDFVLDPDVRQSSASSLNERKSPASGLDERLSFASGVDLRKSPASSLDERMSPASGREERQSSASGLDERHSFASGLNVRQSPPSSLDERMSPASGLVERQSPPSSLDERKSPASGLDERQSPPSSLDERKSPASGLDVRKSPASGLEERQSSASSLDERMSPASGLDERHSPASGLNVRQSPASGLNVRQSPPSSLDERSAPWRRPSLRRSLGMETFPNVLVFRCSTPHSAPKPWSHTDSLSKSPLNSHTGRNREQGSRQGKSLRTRLFHF